MHMYILYLEFLHACTHICVRKILRNYRSQCVSCTWLAAKYRSSCLHMLKTLSDLVQLCPPVCVSWMFGTRNHCSFRDLHCESLLQQVISEAKTQKEWNSQQEQNSCLRMNGVELYKQHDTPPSSYMTEPRHRALVNGATTKWFVWNSVSSKQGNFKTALLYNCFFILFKFAHISFRIIWWVLVGWCTAVFWCFGYLFCHLHQGNISQLWLCIDGGTGSLWDVTLAAHSPFSYWPGWRECKYFRHPKLHTFSIVLSGWGWRTDTLSHLRRLYHFYCPKSFNKLEGEMCKM